MLKQLFTLMLKIGLIGFGGGSALIPVIHKEAVEEKKIISEGEFSKQVVIASITPGALPIELASGIGLHCAGAKGMMIGALAMALPGCFFSILFLALISIADPNVTEIIEICSVGVSSLIMIILSDYVIKTIKSAKRDGRLAKALIIVLSIFVLTSEKKLAAILGISWTPIFNIATIDVFALVFFVAAFTRGNFNRLNWIIVIISSVLYILCVGKGAIINNIYVKWIIEGFMVLAGLFGVHQSDFSGLKDKKIGDILKKEGILVISLGIGIIIAGCINSELALKFAANSLISSLMSFGGGDAFLAVADAMFVVEGFIESDKFYGTIIPIVNVMPGSILCKTLSGIGYCMAYNTYENIYWGLVFAVLGMTAGVVGSCGIFYLVLEIYEKVEDLPFLNVLRCWIQPVISGLLLTVGTSLIYQIVCFGMRYNVTLRSVWFIFFVLCLLSYILERCFCINRLIIAVVLVGAAQVIWAVFI